MPAAEAKLHFEFSDFTEADPRSDPPRPATVSVKISRSDPQYGLVSWSQPCKEGSVLGWSDESGGATSLHVVFSDKRKQAVRLAFDTGVTIERLVVNKLISKQGRRCPIIRTAMAECPGPRPTVEVHRLDEVHYRDRTGQESAYQAGRVLVSGDDEICPAHGGTDAPRWTQAQLKEAMEHEAVQVLYDADADWLSKNPRIRSRSRDSYRRLVRTFTGIEWVRQNWDRIKARSEAEIED